MELGLNGKVVLVTGAGSGIGRAIALSLASEGARLVATDMQGDTAEATAAEAANRGAEAIGATLDVTQYKQARTVVQEAVQRFGRLDVLVNCAGAWRIGLFMDMQPEDWAFEINVRAESASCVRSM